METTASPLIVCENCRTQSLPTLTFCPQCSFPVGGTDEDKTKFRLLISSKKRLLNDAQSKIKSAKIAIWVVAGLTFLGGLFVGLVGNDFPLMIVDFILAVAFLGLAAWADNNPFGAILTAFIIYITLHVINAVADPSTIAQGIIVKIFVIAAFVKGMRSAQEAQGFLKELEKVKAAPVGLE